MKKKLAERKERNSDAIQESKPRQDSSVSIDTLAAMSHGMVKVEKT